MCHDYFPKQSLKSGDFPLERYNGGFLLPSAVLFTTAASKLPPVGFSEWHTIEKLPCIF